MSEATCKTCPWWKDELGTARGECRVSPPRLVEPTRSDDPWTGAWPTTHMGDWCGEHPERRQP